MYAHIPYTGELDAYKNRVNNSAKRADRNKILPHGVPNDICLNPSEYGVLDFKISVQQEAIQEARTLFSPPDHSVFELVPKSFSNMDFKNLKEAWKIECQMVHIIWEVLTMAKEWVNETHSAELDYMMNVDDPLPYREQDLAEIEVNFTSDEDFSNGDGTW
ncbi:hypothetical protein BDQ17DRAFT_1329045 [Cyathus striatus]|nr:hypothetical protein BDQ17DRAFT_1329045 [Cyathus striatus]